MSVSLATLHVGCFSWGPSLVVARNVTIPTCRDINMLCKRLRCRVLPLQWTSRSHHLDVLDTTACCLQSPAEIVDFDVIAETMAADQASAPTSEGDEDMLCSPYVHVPNPMFDYIPPELISLFVTDTGGYTPSYVYRLLAEYYTRDDYNL